MTSPRAALYARYSTDQQREASIADQLHAARRLAAQLGAEIVAEASDAAISGQAMANRPGFQEVMALARTGAIDLVLCEHTDRLTRDGGHAYDVYYDLAAQGVRIHTVNQGEIGLMHVGTSGLMSALFIDELRKKVRRGLEGVVREGRYTGAPAYGYRAAVAYDAAGERLRGLREIVPEEAEVVRRIFADTAAGLTAGEIVAALNREGVRTRTGRPWNRAAIHGRVDLPTGILRNELYRGRLVWGRVAKRKDRRTGKSTAAPNPAELQHRPAPDLRIVSDELWDAAHARLAARAQGEAKARRGSRRGPTLLGGLIRCGCCGGRMVSAGPKDLIRCSGRALYGQPCDNARTPSYAQVQARVLASVQANLLHPDVVAEAVRAYREAEAEAQAAAGRDRAHLQRQLTDARRRQAQLVARWEAEPDMPWAAIAPRHAELQTRIDDLTQALDAASHAEAAPETNKVATLPGAAAHHYRKAVEALADLASRPQDDTTLTAPDAAAREAVRALIDDVRIYPRAGRGQYAVDLTANLAPLLFSEPMRVAENGRIRL